MINVTLQILVTTVCTTRSDIQKSTFCPQNVLLPVHHLLTGFSKGDKCAYCIVQTAHLNTGCQKTPCPNLVR